MHGYGCNETSTAALPARLGRSFAEIMVAVAISGGAIVGLDRYGGAFTESLSVAEQRVMAGELAAERIHAARVAGVHADTMATLESTIPGYPGFTRVTAVRRVGGAADSVSYRVVTTAVLATGLTKPVRRTVIVGSARPAAGPPRT